MKKCLFILFINLLLTSCSPNDDIIQEQQNRGFIEMEYNGEKLSFGKNAFNGWLLNNQKDTIARFYTARITKDAKNFYDVKLYCLFKQGESVKRLSKLQRRNVRFGFKQFAERL